MKYFGAVVYAAALVVFVAPGAVRAQEPVAGVMPATFAGAACRADLVGEPMRQIQYDPRLDTVFTTEWTAEGAAVLSARHAEFEFRKVTQPNGRLTLVVEARGDRVSMSMDGSSLEVVRGARSVTLSATDPTDDTFLTVREALAGSRAIRLFRSLAATIDPATKGTVATAGILLSDALIGVFDGDPGAIDRLGRALAAKRRARLQLVRLEDTPGCYELWENEVMRAWIEYERCKKDFSWWNPLQELCTLRWMLWVETAWFALIKCAALPINT